MTVFFRDIRQNNRIYRTVSLCSIFSYFLLRLLSALCIAMLTMSSEVFAQVLLAFCFFQVDAMLQKLEKEIDYVDAKIGDCWQVLDRYVWRYISGAINYFWR